MQELNRFAVVFAFNVLIFATPMNAQQKRLVESPSPSEHGKGEMPHKAEHQDDDLAKVLLELTFEFIKTSSKAITHEVAHQIHHLCKSGQRTSGNVKPARQMGMPVAQTNAGNHDPAGSQQAPPSAVVEQRAPTPPRCLQMKPPENPRVAHIPLADLHLSPKAHKTPKVNAAYAFHGDRLLVNKHFHHDKNYLLLHGVKMVNGYYRYRGKLDSHWHHAVWAPDWSCFFFFDFYSSSYYYWNEEDDCYYPCWWDVDWAALHAQAAQAAK